MGEVIKMSRVGSTEVLLLASSSIERSPESPNQLYSADILVDRTSIEQQAQELIRSRSLIETSYKTEQTYQNDARTLLFEALTASGHLSRVEIGGTLPEIHSTMLSVLLNSYSDALPEHEKQRRFQEICEELTIQAVELRIVSGQVPPKTEVATISDYVVDGALSADVARAIGYRADNKKGMVRSNRLVNNLDGTYSRVSEQISRSNANAQETTAFLVNNGIAVRADKAADVAVLGTQLIHECEEGVVGIQRRLDQFKGLGLRYGELASERHISYKDLRVESAERERIAECYINRLADFTRSLDDRLASGEITTSQYQEIFKAEVHSILEAICVLRPSYAKDCFGERAEAGFVRASNFTASGDYGAASREVSQNRHLEGSVTFCGMSISAQQAKDIGADVDSMTSLLKLGREGWKKTIGKCRVENCVSPKPTEVGGCSVCLGGCQRLFDKGMNYQQIVQYYGQIRKQKMKKTGMFATQASRPAWTLDNLFEPKDNSKKNPKREKMAA